MESTPCDGLANSRNADSPRTQPHRRDPEKRRKQNLEAQKRYRQKIKQRLQACEGLTASTVVQHGALNPPMTNPASDILVPGPVFSLDDQEAEPASTFPGLDSHAMQQTPQSIIQTSRYTPGTFTLGNYASLDPSLTDDESYDAALLGTLVHCGCSDSHYQIISLAPRRFKNLRPLQHIAVHPSFDPYLNTLRVEPACIIQSLFANCLHIGITDQMMCDDDATSPFYRSGCEAGSFASPNSAVLANQRIFRSLKPDLRPIKEQITTAHHPFLDVLPFPTLRRNMIREGATALRREFCYDLLNGLICWGAGGLGRRDRDASSGFLSSGTSWDSRSWEAKPWFLQKYWTVLGEDEGELVRQSEWWRAMRGEETGEWGSA